MLSMELQSSPSRISSDGSSGRQALENHSNSSYNAQAVAAQAVAAQAVAAQAVAARGDNAAEIDDILADADQRLMSYEYREQSRQTSMMQQGCLSPRLSNRQQSLGLTIEELDDRGLIDGGGSLPGSQYSNTKQKNRRSLEFQSRSHRLQGRNVNKESVTKSMNTIVSLSLLSFLLFFPFHILLTYLIFSLSPLHSFTCYACWRSAGWT
jgi:hypothetical protein